MHQIYELAGSKEVHFGHRNPTGMWREALISHNRTLGNNGRYRLGVLQLLSISRLCFETKSAVGSKRGLEGKRENKSVQWKLFLRRQY